MSNLSISGKVNAIIISHLDIEASDLLTGITLGDLGADDLDATQIALALEDELDVDLGWFDESAETTVDELVEACERELGAKPLAVGRRGDL